MTRTLVRAAVLTAALAGATALGACGFTPLYNVPGVQGGLSHIEVVAPPQDRVGFLMHEDLDDDFGHDQGAPPLYRLSMTLKQVRTAHGLTENATAQRYELDMRVDYALTEIATGKVVKQGSVVSNVSYDSADQPYAGIAARQDTQDRMASDAARRIELEIAAWMAGRQGG